MLKSQLNMSKADIKSHAKEYKKKQTEIMNILSNFINKKRLYREYILLKNNYNQEFTNVDLYLIDEDTINICATFMGYKCVYEVNRLYSYLTPPNIYINDILYVMDSCDFSPVMTIASLFISYVTDETNK